MTETQTQRPAAWTGALLDRSGHTQRDALGWYGLPALKIQLPAIHLNDNARDQEAYSPLITRDLEEDTAY